LIAYVGDTKQFKHGRQMAAYPGLTPQEHSSGGKRRLLGIIAKIGNMRLRRLLVPAARAVILGIERRKREGTGLPRLLVTFDR
jgi:transposase